MKPDQLLIVLMSLVVMTSCRSIRTLTNRDSAVYSSQSHTTTTTSKRTFLTGIEVTPGFDSKSSEQKEALVKDAATNKNEKRLNNHPIAGSEKGFMETATLLQVKYAIATDVPVEKLTNIPLLALIDKWWGTKYCMGGNTENCIDCSAFTQIIMRDIYQQSLPRTSQEQYMFCERIDVDELREGDLVFFNTSGREISHVGVYLLNNKFVHASTTGGVMISDLNEKYWQAKFRGAGRGRILSN